MKKSIRKGVGKRGRVIESREEGTRGWRKRYSVVHTGLRDIAGWLNETAREKR